MERLRWIATSAASRAEEAQDATERAMWAELADLAADEIQDRWLARAIEDLTRQRSQIMEAIDRGSY